MRCNEHLVPVLTYTAKELEEGKEYQFRVRAENAAGISEPSRATPPTKAVDPIGMFCLMELPLFHCKINETNVLPDIFIRIENNHHFNHYRCPKSHYENKPGSETR
jgi:hypothetical protein